MMMNMGDECKKRVMLAAFIYCYFARAARSLPMSRRKYLPSKSNSFIAL
jgi:hypothetical protein